MMKIPFYLIFLLSAMGISSVSALTITHGPILGRPGTTSMGIWARTDKPGEFTVVCINQKNPKDLVVATASTHLSDDNTGVAMAKGLQPGSTYYYLIEVNGKPHGTSGKFRTIPDSNTLKTTPYNPDGLFNFSFEFACGNNQNPKGGMGPTLPTYNTLNKQEKDKVLFAILNGDWLYEEDRDYSHDQWRKQVKIKKNELPEVVKIAPTITGVWENYKTYMARGKNLMEWQRQVPTFYTFDDHELLNDVFGSGTPGYRNRRAVFRDIAIEGWFDYLGWANPVALDAPIHFGTASMKKGSNILTDPATDFTALPLQQMANLHVHWNTPDAGVKDIESGDTEGGEPNANVYGIEEVLDANRLRIKPSAVEDAEVPYSIGRQSYGSFRVSNCQFFLVDTRTNRELHDVKNPGKPNLSMLGIGQREWIMREMKASDASFFFVVSSVNFMIPHVGGGGHHFDAATKDDAWTVFLEEREMLIDFWDELGKPVFVLTGDLHNSFAVKITDRVWEFASGPHNSVNHRPEDEGNRPITGRFKYGPRACDIRWSTAAMSDIPRENRHFPHYCVVQVNNVFNNPIEKGGTRHIAYEHPQVIFKYYHGLTGELAYAETISTPRK